MKDDKALGSFYGPGLLLWVRWEAIGRLWAREPQDLTYFNRTVKAAILRSLWKYKWVNKDSAMIQTKDKGGLEHRGQQRPGFLINYGNNAN